MKGGIALLTDGHPSYAWPMPTTERDIYDLLLGISHPEIAAYLEKVNAFPGQGVASTWKFAEGYGVLKGLLTALKIPFTLVSPGVWQRELGCLTKGDKNVSKRKAQQLYPELTITHATADALLIATWGKMQSSAH